MTPIIPIEEQRGMLAQHYAMKQKHYDAILLFHYQDVYMAFNDDAKECAEILGGSFDRIPALGDDVRSYRFRRESLDMFLPKLVRAGKRVAIYAYLDNSKDNGAKIF